MQAGDFLLAFCNYMSCHAPLSPSLCSNCFGLRIALTRHKNAFLLLTFSTVSQHNDRDILLAYCKQNISLFVRIIPIHTLLSSSAQHYSLRTIYNYIE